MEAKVKAQTAPNKDVQREIADLGEVVMASFCLFLIQLRSKTLPVLKLFVPLFVVLFKDRVIFCSSRLA